jgi:hypothetical protein
LLGNPLIRPWQYHAALVDDFQMEDFRFGSYYICCGTKPERGGGVGLLEPIAAANSGAPETAAANITAASKGVLRMVPPDF